MSDLDTKFNEFHSENPHVYARIEATALELLRAKRKRISIRDVWGYIRIQRLVVASNSDFNLNNSYVSRYARMLLAKRPELRGVIELRDLTTSKKKAQAPKLTLVPKTGPVKCVPKAEPKHSLDPWETLHDVLMANV